MRIKRNLEDYVSKYIVAMAEDTQGRQVMVGAAEWVS